METRDDEREVFQRDASPLMSQLVAHQSPCRLERRLEKLSVKRWSKQRKKGTLFRIGDCDL